MIVQAIFSIMLKISDIVFGWLPDGKTLPTLLGVNLDTTFSTGIGYVRNIATLYPPLAWISLAAVTYLGWKIILLLIKVILGHRAPIISHNA